MLNGKKALHSNRNPISVKKEKTAATEAKTFSVTPLSIANTNSIIFPFDQKKKQEIPSTIEVSGVQLIEKIIQKQITSMHIPTGYIGRFIA